MHPTRSLRLFCLALTLVGLGIILATLLNVSAAQQAGGITLGWLTATTGIIALVIANHTTNRK